MFPLRTCAIIGSGNVATALAPALARILCVRQVYSPHIENAGRLADLVGAEAIDTPEQLNPSWDFYLVSVSDDAIKDVALSCSHISDGLWAHTSGSVDMGVLGSKKNYGVLYPLQTFTKENAIDLSEVPFFIEGSSESAFKTLSELAGMISSKVYPADSELRANLHLSAVFACNFVNLMWIEAEEILRRNGLGLEVLYPLLEQTLRKVKTMPPDKAQTGPARRGDFSVINRHLTKLDAEAAEIYKILSQKIYNIYNE